MGRSIGLCVCLLVATAHAEVDERAAAREHYLKGTKAYDLGAYDEAIAEYSLAYRAKDDQALLYNIAQAHRLAGHPADAMRFYRMYLTKSPHAPNRGEVESRIVELQKTLERPAASPDAVKQPEPSVEPANPTVAEAAPAVTLAVANPAIDAHAGRAKKAAGLAVVGVGVAALAAGIGLSVVAKQYKDDLADPARPYDPREAGALPGLGSAGVALLAVGGAAVVAGVVVTALGFREAKAVRVSASSLQVRF